MRKLFYFLMIQFIGVNAGAQVNVTELLTENKTGPIGVNVIRPRFSWQILSDKNNSMQSAYEIKVESGGSTVWDSKKILSEQSVHVIYDGKSLESNKKYSWQVKIWDNNGRNSSWSQPAFFQMALLNKTDWKAKWIEPDFQEEATRPSPIFRKQFLLNKKIISATAYITAHGLYEATMNGQRVGDAYLTPGWTSYNKRLQYQAYDVTNLLKNGNNVVGVTLASGWYRGIMGYENNKNIYGKDIALLFQLNISYNDGTSEIISSDGTWKSSTASIRYAEIYNGETIDAKMNKKGWALPGFNDLDWSSVRIADHSFDNLIATDNEPVRKHETFLPKRIITTPKGEKVIDFGQNLVGWVVVKVKGKAGDKITISHAEVLDKKGNFYTDNLRAAKAQDTYILNGEGEETFEPHFTWHGFQFVKIEGYPGELKPENFSAVALYSDMKPTGTFSSSNVLVNQLQHNIQWGQKGNFLDIPTDCPQRDERLGWTGDAQVFSRTASFNMNVNNFFSKWLKDVAADQVDGVVPFVIPNVLGKPTNSTGWADVATIVPWNMYLAYGDKKILEGQYPSMKAYVESIHKNAKNDLWNTGFHFGDWLFYSPEDDNSGRSAVTDKYLIAQCFYAQSTQLLINAARVLGRSDEVNLYTPLLHNIKEAFLKEYVTTNGRLVSGTQTAYVLALNFDMLPESLRTQAAIRLVDNIKSYGNHLTTGFLGTPYLCHVLTRFGYDDIAYKLLLQDTYPSWLYPVKMGATTIWERWDGIKPDSTFETPSMNSYNHYSYGAIGDWMYRRMVGIDTYEDGVGYKHIKIQPHIGGGFSNASATLKTYYGSLSNSWKVEGNNVIMDVEIPANTTANIFIPSDDPNKIMENGKSLILMKHESNHNTEKGYSVITVGSGKYQFSFPKPNQ